MTALSASSETRPGSFGQFTAEQMLEIYQGSNQAGLQIMVDDSCASLVVTSLASTVECLIKGLHSSEAMQRWKVHFLLWQVAHFKSDPPA